MDEKLQTHTVQPQEAACDGNPTPLIDRVPWNTSGDVYKDPEDTVEEIRAQLAGRAIDGTNPAVLPGAQSRLTRKA